MGSYSDKPRVTFSAHAKNPQQVLESVDRELSFFRKRSGQVFWIGLLVEAIILVGQQEVKMSDTWQWQRACVETFFFLAIAGAGMALGSEYRRRIHILKDSRCELLDHLGYNNVFPEASQQRISEIQVLYVVLIILSSVGILIYWLKVYPVWWIFGMLLIGCAVATVIGARAVWGCVTTKRIQDT